MQIITDAPARKPDVIVRLTPEEAGVFRELFGNTDNVAIAGLLNADASDARKSLAVGLCYDFFYQLEDLGY